MPDAKTRTRRKAPAAKGGGDEKCSVEGCKRAFRAKGLCFFHYKKWRRGELDGRPARYKTCSRPDCRKKTAAHGLCQEHFDAWKRAREGAEVAAEAPAAPAEAPAGG